MNFASDFLIENNVLIKYTGNEKEVVIPEGVTAIGAYAFYENLRVERVTLPAQVNAIGSSAFELCRKLESINLPQGLTRIGDYAFRLCRKLKSITIPGSCQSTGYMAFFGCSNLESLTLGEGVQIISGYSFVNCTELKQICWPESLKTVSDAAFNTCTSLPEVILPEGVCTVEPSAFGGCISVSCVVLPRAVMDSVDAKWFRSRFNNVDLNLLWLCGKTNFDKRVAALCAKSIMRKKEEYFAMILQRNHGQAMANFLASLGKVPADLLSRYLEDAGAKGAAEVSAVLLEYQRKNYTFAELEQEEEESTLKALGLQEYTVADWRKIFKFSISHGSVTITGYRGNQKAVTIPAKIGKNSVATFSLAGIPEICGRIREVTVEPGIQNIGDDAFDRCVNLEALHIPASVTWISSTAIWDCSRLTIYAPAGSYAEDYAREKSIPFVAE